MDESLAEAADLAYQLAPSCCRADCVNYHGLVGYLRLLRLVPDPQRHGRFFRDRLVSAAARGARAVLIAGAADQSMFAHVLSAFKLADEQPRVTVVDRCPTPLRINEWFAARRAAPLCAQCKDLVELAPDQAFDVICTDGVLLLIDPSRRSETLRRWSLALRPGGRVITTVRLGVGPSSGETAAPAVIEAFAARVEAEAKRTPGLLPVAPERLRDLSRSYLRSIRSYPYDSVLELERQFAAAGLALEELDVRQMKGRVDGHERGPGTLQAAPWARVVASRREGPSAAGTAGSTPAELR